jgi:broad specificity phosphatase PhoE
MRIGLARHFQIPHDKGQLLDSGGFAEWIRWYDGSAAEKAEAEPSSHAWDKCYCSDLHRAHFTAGKLHPGPLEVTPLLREVPFAPFFSRGPRLPLYIWETLSRLGWMVGHRSQPENRKQTLKRIEEFLEMLRTRHRGENVLIVSHGFLMRYMQRALNRAGFKGKVPVRPQGGRVYLFEAR